MRRVCDSVCVCVTPCVCERDVTSRLQVEAEPLCWRRRPRSARPRVVPPLSVDSVAGEMVTKQPLIRSMRTVKRETLKLISGWVSRSNDPQMVSGSEACDR